MDSHAPPADSPAAASAPASGAEHGASIASQAILQGQRSATIEHNGERYRLQETRAGKLILTK